MLFDFAEIDMSCRGELYHMLYKKIKQACLDGALKKGEKLPSIREAAKQLGVSRTTIENAYIRLCIEGFAESRPQRGYFITEATESYKKPPEKEKNIQHIEFDFSSRKIDTAAADTQVWKKTVRSVLCDSGELTSYSDSQGESGLRNALATYSYKARGVRTTADDIVIGAGIGPLLNILCGLLGRNIHIGFENGGFYKAQSILEDYGIKYTNLDFDSSGAKIQSIEENNIDTLFLLPSALSKIGVTSLSKRRNEYCSWVSGEDNRIIIEDDYNGELRYTARSVPAFQSKAPERTVYIGSFSKLLLPSVRIAYMVLPPHLSEQFRKRKNTYNQTCGKIDQLALEQYIENGSLEKHLRRLRRLYYTKSQLLCSELLSHSKRIKSMTLYESSLTVEVKTNIQRKSKEICDYLLANSIRLMECDTDGCVRLCFAGINKEDIPQAAKKISELLENFFNQKM